ncbi:phosphate ABC transporter permease [Haloprofundus halophilus]|uniref:phosphate ABC transporter permease n=1 Tax=Haloprofundus halophilus TaxID=2283527 RepID=UPI000E44901A|nr:phosphate ABC transporter permease [Haloprofundus halophilus]
MSNEPSSERPSTGEEPGATVRTNSQSSRNRDWPRSAVGRDRLVLAASVAALGTVAFATTIGVVRNLPARPLAVPGPLHSLAVDGTPVVVAVALVAVALATRRDEVRVGFLFAGVFGLLATVGEGATLPAVAAVVFGGALALFGALGRPATYREGRRVVIGALVIAGIAVSLASNTGVLGAGFRGVGGLLALGGLAALGVRAEGDRVALLAGGLAVALVVYASVTRPFAVGSGLLVGFAVVDVPHLFVALALGGGTAAAVGGLRRREYGSATGTGLLLLAGVPATLPRATAVLLGATLALTSTGRLAGEDSREWNAKGGPE